MNTYDFDKTIYINDSSCDFVIYCLKKYPAAVIPAMFRSGVKGIKHILGMADTKELKEQVFSFLKHLDDVESIVASFWEEKFDGVGQWYLNQQKPDDVIISASPEFLLRPVAGKLGFYLIGTVMDKSTGKIMGLNCHDSEKVRRFHECFPDGHTEEFYSDSLTDSPMADIAERAYMVDRGKLSPWPQK